MIPLLLTGLALTDFPKPTDLKPNPNLPDPLIAFDGTKITSAEDWRTKRAPELRELFQHYMYGRMLPKPKSIKTTVLHEDTKAFGGKAVLREIQITLTPGEEFPIYLLVVIPLRNAPVPAFVGVNFSGNHSLVTDPKVRIPTAWMPPRYPGVVNNKATEAGRGKFLDVWAFEQAIERNYAIATFYCGDLAPDTPEAKTIASAFAEYQPKAADATATIAIWAWGLMRAVDVLSGILDIDAKQIAVVGHSRLGKTALLAAAFDERIALAIPSQAGCGGTAPSRGKVGETVKQINDRFPHWFTTNFKAFNDDPTRLPFDQNCLAALVAPRPLLFSNAVEDTWANPNGQYEALRGAEGVYRLLGASSNLPSEPPAVNKLVDGPLGYFIRPGKHSMTPIDWAAWFDFADKHFDRK